MPTFSPEYLFDTAVNIYQAAGVPEDEARIVATHQVKANLVGHDSHGVILLPTYLERMEKGFIVPGAPINIERETSTTARINGNWGFGFVVTEKAMQLAIEKAKKHSLAAITVLCQSHIGRLGDYPTMAAQEDMIGLITADSGAGPKSVAPFGGRERRLGTNPLSIGIPSNLDGPVLLDMATCTVAAGKVGVARARNKALAPGLIVDKEGNPTVDPNAFYAGGSILPLGGSQGHKGYGLSFMVEVLSGILTGVGFGSDPKEFQKRHGVEYRHNDGCFINVINVDAFYPIDEFRQEVTDFVAYLKTSQPAKGFTDILYPGEIEWLNEQRRRSEGIYIEDSTWDRITSIQKQFGIKE